MWSGDPCFGQSEPLFTAVLGGGGDLLSKDLVKVASSFQLILICSIVRRTETSKNNSVKHLHVYLLQAMSPGVNGIALSCWGILVVRLVRTCCGLRLYVQAACEMGTPQISCPPLTPPQPPEQKKKARGMTVS